MFDHFLRILILTLLASAVQAQERVSVQHGDWTAPSTWSDGVIPTASNSTSVVVGHDVVITAGETIFVDQLTVEGTLVVDPGAELRIVNGDGADLELTTEATLTVYGVLTGSDSVDFEGMTAVNTTFAAGSSYRHLATREGEIPVATWDPDARLEITGIAANVSMRSPQWDQVFGTVVYDCPTQGEFVEFNGRLGQVTGDLIVSNTNGNRLILSRSGESRLDVVGDVLIQGPSVVWFSVDGNSTLSVGGDFYYNSEATASSYFTTTGQATVLVNGNFTLDARHRLKMASSTAAGHTALALKGNFRMLRGRMDALGSGSGAISFEGPQPQQVDAVPGEDAGFEGNISYYIAPSADVDLQESLLANTTGGDMIVDGTVRLGSGNGDGMIQAGDGGNINVSGSIVFGETSKVIFNGAAMQYIAYGDLATDVVVDNPAGVTLTTDVQLGNLLINRGQFADGGQTVWLRGDLSCEEGGAIDHDGTLVLNGAGEQTIDIRGNSLDNVTVDQEVSGTIRIASTLRLAGRLSIVSPGSAVASDGNLVLLSSSEAPGSTASIGAIPDGSAVTGAVEVHRFIQGAAGDHYRYISSPVAGATVASLMDDVPVTGIFDDSDTGPGLPEDAPSLFIYSEETAGWIPFPLSGTSSANYFEPGKGYCFFNWNESADTDWDVRGPVNQGSIAFDVTYSPKGDAQLDGWNLVGNPYPATVRWGDVGWVSENISPSIAVRDNLTGGFRYWDGQAGSLSGGLIASGQSFWVRSVAPDPVLSISEDAKASGDAEYYRRRPPDFIALTVAAGRQTDQAFIRIREGSSEDLDSFDAPKLRNDSLSLSFLTPDKVEVAIAAVPELGCRSQIPLVVGGVDGNWELTFLLKAEGIFRGSTFALVDTVGHRRFAFDDRGVLRIPGEYNLTALQLVIESGIPTPVDAVASEVVCPGDTLVVELQRMDKGIAYYLENAGRRYWPLPADGTASLRFLANSLPQGRSVYALMGASACSGPVIIDSIAVVTPSVPDPLVREGFRCGHGSIELEVRASPGYEVRWYDSPLDATPVAFGNSFLTPPLEKSAWYYVSVTDQLGCESRRVPLAATIRPDVTAAIEREGETLKTPFAKGASYQWYLNDVTLHEERSNWIVPVVAGRYKVVVQREDCVSFDEYDVGRIVSSVPGDVRPRPFTAFPVPCNSVLHIRLTAGWENRGIRVYTSGGRILEQVNVVEEEDGFTVDLSRVPAGTYFVRVLGKIDHAILRFVKTE